MEGKRMPVRYRMDETGQMRRTWNGKLPEEFNRRDMLLFAADNDLALYGRVTQDTLDAAREAGYSYENGAFIPLQETGHRKEGAAAQPGNTMEIRVKVHHVQKGPGSLRAFASATIGGCFAVNGIRVMDGENGIFVAMPSSRGSDGKYRDICCPTTAEMRKALNMAVMGEYEKAVEKPSVRGALQEAVKGAAARPAPEGQKTVDKGAR